MKLDDIPQVVEIDQLSFSLPWPKSAFRYELIENTHSLTYVAELVGPTSEYAVVGACVIWLILDEAHIATLATHPNYRRMGIARLLLVQALLDSIPHGCTSATLEVRAGNLAAQALYQKFGFEVVGARPKYYQDNQEDALIMTMAPMDSAYREWLNNTSATLNTIQFSERPQDMRSAD